MGKGKKETAKSLLGDYTAEHHRRFFRLVKNCKGEYRGL